MLDQKKAVSFVLRQYIDEEVFPKLYTLKQLAQDLGDITAEGFIQSLFDNIQSYEFVMDNKDSSPCIVCGDRVSHDWNKIPICEEHRKAVVASKYCVVCREVDLSGQSRTVCEDCSADMKTWDIHALTGGDD